MYGTALSIRYDGGGARAFYRDLPARLREAARKAGLTVDAILERRPRGAPAATPTASAPCRSMASPPDGEIEIRENGLRFGVDLRRGQKGGLFLDQRENRALVRTLARERRVLNLFGYTGGFSIYAAAGGARATTTVDVAAPAIASARRNFERNRLPDRRRALRRRGRLRLSHPGRRRRRAVRAGDLRSAELRAQPARASRRASAPTSGCIACARRSPRPGGSSAPPHARATFERDAFLATVRDGAREAGRRAQVREVRGAAVDHPVVPQFPEGDYLKFAVIQL